MSKDKTNPALAIVEKPVEITGSLAIDKDDIIAIAVTDAETKMQAQLDAAKKSQKDLNKEAEQVTKELDEIVLAEFTGKVEKQSAATIALYKSWGVDVTANPTAQLKQVYNKDKKEHEWKQISGQLNFEEDPEGRRHPNLEVHSYPSLHFTFNCKAATTKLKLKIAELQEQAKAAGEEAMEWKKKLTQLPRMERQYRARLAAARLQKDDIGREILEDLLGGVDDSVALLPGN